jgi:hypothetical protein
MSPVQIAEQVQRHIPGVDIAAVAGSATGVAGALTVWFGVFDLILKIVVSLLAGAASYLTIRKLWRERKGK